MKNEMSRKLNRKSRGQGMTEYIIIVALIAIAAIAVVTLFGDNVRQLFAASSGALTGADQTNGAQTASQSIKKRNLTTFAQNTSTY